MKSSFRWSLWWEQGVYFTESQALGLIISIADYTGASMTGELVTCLQQNCSYYRKGFPFLDTNASASSASSTIQALLEASFTKTGSQTPLHGVKELCSGKGTETVGSRIRDFIDSVLCCIT